MIKTTISLLNLGDLYGKTNNIDIAKGKYKLPETIKEGIKQFKRVKNEKRGS